MEPTSLEESLRSGYVFAAILNQYQLIENIAAFQNSTSTDVSIKNYTLLEPVLRAIGVNLSATTAYELISGKPGVAQNLDEAIKAYKHRPFVQLKMKQKETIPKYILEASSKKTFIQKEHEFFADRLKSKFRRLPPITSLHTVVAKTPEVNYQKSAGQESPARTSKLKKNALNIIDEQEPDVKSSSTEEQILEESWSQKSKRVSEQQANIHQLKKEAKQKELKKKKAEILNELAKEIDVFDKQQAKWQKREQHKTDTNQFMPAEIRELRRQIHESNVDSETHAAHLKQKLNSDGFQQQQSKTYLNHIRDKRVEYEMSRKEREQRRRKILLGQQKAQLEFEREQRDTILLEKLAKQSKQERRISEQLLETKNEKEIIRQNRINRDQQYQDRRQKDYEEALNREVALSEQLRREYRRQVQMQAEQYEEIVAQRKIHLHEKHYKFCREIMDGILDFTDNMIHHVEVNDGNVSEKLINQWTLLFTKGLPLKENYSKKIEVEKINITEEKSDNPAKDSATTAQVEPEKDNEEKPKSVERVETQPTAVQLAGITEMDEAEFQDYLAGSGSWPYISPEELSPVKNEHLGMIVDGLLKLSATPERRPYVSQLAPHPLKVIMIGKRFSGKHTIANKLAQLCGVSVLTLQDIIKQAIHASDSNETVVDEKGKSVSSVRAQFGSKLQESLLQGKPADEALVTSLVADAIRTLNAAIATDTKASGWILVDYPRNKLQAQALEKELSGYEVPKPVKLGNLKRPTGGKESAGKERTKNRSQIAPSSASNQDQATAPESAIDIVFVLDVDNDIAIKRSCGRQLDPITNNVYHLEYNPPPANEPGLMERLVPIEDESNSDAQIHHQLVAFDEQKNGIQEWFSRFDNLKLINASEVIDDVMRSVEASLLPIIGKKQGDECKPETPGESGEKVATQQPQTGEAAATVLPPQSEQISAGNSSANSAAKPQSAGNAASASKPQTAGALVSDPAKIVEFPVVEGLIRHSPFIGSKGITRELANILTVRWLSVESAYTEGIKFLFRSLRREKDAAIRYFFETKMSFKEFLLRPDKKQALVDAFQKDYNQIEDDLRAEPEAKAEFHQRSEDLREKIWNISDERKDEAETERLNIIETRWVEDHLAILVNLYLTAVQLEVDRYVSTKQLLIDYTKDVNEVLLDETTISFPKIALLDLSTNPDGLFSDILKIKHDLPPNLMPANVSPKKPATAQVGQKKGSAHVKKVVADKTSVTEQTSETITLSFSDHPIESDGIYNHLINSINTALTFITDFDFVESNNNNNEKGGKNDKKKTVEAQVESKENHPEHLQEAIKAIKLENIITKRRIERLKVQAIEHLKELKTKAFESFMSMDEWIGNKFQSEMEAVRDLINYVKDAIELEQKLSNELILESDNFIINADVLTVEPEIESRPQSPIETKKADSFTILQLLNLAVHLNELAPSGILSTKTFKEAIIRLASTTSGKDWFPDQYISKLADIAFIQKIIKLNDPYGIGLMNWRHFLVKNANILPVSESQIDTLKKSIESLSTNGLLSYSDFIGLPFWFDTQEDYSTFEKFNRPAKLKQALFFIFAVDNGEIESKPNSQPRWINDHQQVTCDHLLLDSKSFLHALCFDDVPSVSIQKAFYAFSHNNDGTVTESELMQIYQIDATDIAETERFDEEWNKLELFPAQTITNAFEGRSTIDFDTWSSICESIFLTSDLYMLH